MATEEQEGGGSGEPGGRVDEAIGDQEPAAVGDYTWDDFRREYHTGGPFDKSRYLGFDPLHVEGMLAEGATAAKTVDRDWQAFLDVDSTPVAKDAYTWEHFKREYYYTETGEAPRGPNGERVPFDPSEYLGFDPAQLDGRLGSGGDTADRLAEIVDERTVNVNPDIDEDEFFSTAEGATTVVNRYDLEKAVPMARKQYFDEVERYWVNKPYSCVVVFHSTKENETKYYAVEPYLNEIETDVREFVEGKLKTTIKYSDEDVVIKGTPEDRAEVIERETERLLERYDLFSGTPGGKNGDGGTLGQVKAMLGLGGETDEASPGLEGIEARPEPVVLDEDPAALTEYQVEKLMYMLKRGFVGYDRIDPIKHDINVEDISCDGYNSRVFVYHSEYEQIITNVEHGESGLDDFVIKLAQRSGQGISKRTPQVDATLPDGSRAQLTLGREVSDHGTNYTIRQFKDVPFTPIDLINWNTFSLDEMAFLWLCIENNKSLIFAGGTASGKTTSLNAVSLFIPSNTKIVSIEDTREVELPQRNWVASVTRPSFGNDDTSDIDEFDLLEAALRQRPDYIVMGEVRGEEGRTLFQVMSTGHTTYTTFHADSVGEVIKRFTTDPINVSKTLFTALDLVSIQTQTRVKGRKVRRNKTLTEINEYSPENDEINVRDVYQWQAETDTFLQMGNSNTLEEIKFDRGWDEGKLNEELFKRKVVLAHLIDRGMNSYTEVAASIQAFINDPDAIMTLIAENQLERSLEDLREMESVKINIDPAEEELVPRPDPGDDLRAEAAEIIENAEPLYERYRSMKTPDIVSALTATGAAEDIAADAGDADAGDADADDDEIDFGQFVPKAGTEAEES